MDLCITAGYVALLFFADPRLPSSDAGCTGTAQQKSHLQRTPELPQSFVSLLWAN